jgi:hypothetical protein
METCTQWYGLTSTATTHVIIAPRLNTRTLHKTSPGGDLSIGVPTVARTSKRTEQHAIPCVCTVKDGRRPKACGVRSHVAYNQVQGQNHGTRHALPPRRQRRTHYRSQRREWSRVRSTTTHIKGGPNSLTQADKAPPSLYSLGLSFSSARKGPYCKASLDI